MIGMAERVHAMTTRESGYDDWMPLATTAFVAFLFLFKIAVNLLLR